ncbi:MAG TPA: Wzz/FepE/Etk N-terminal domain-containing protein [Methylocella sp.]|nr:Wzz/FepE/Etk N-terminal domain-containing protein [Methylocella sp.]
MFQPPFPLNDRHELDRDSLVEASVRAVNILRLVSAIRRRAWIFAAFCLSSICVGVLYVLTATPLYTASANIVLDKRQVRSIRDVSTLSDTPMLDAPEIVETEVEVLRSDKVGMAVVKALNLQPDDPAFASPNWIQRIWSSGPSSGPSSGGEQDLARQLQVLRGLGRNLHVSRVGHTFVMQVEYTSASPSRAAEIVNAYADAYLAEQLNLGIEEAHNAQMWLKQRTEELRRMSLSADLDVQKFKAEHDLLSTKGMLTSEQQFNEMMTQLVVIRATTAQAKARYERVKNIIDNHQTEAAVTESLHDPVINELRTKYLDATRRLSELEPKVGHDHITVVDLKGAIAELTRLLFQEFSRVAETYRNDYDVALAHEKALNASLISERSVAVKANDAQVQLRQLEQKAETYKSLYQTFLQRSQETGKEESFSSVDAHIISTAKPPLAPSSPRTALVLGISVLLGLVAGAGAAALREFTDYVFRTTEQVRAELGVDVLGLLPMIPSEYSERFAAEVAPLMRYAIDNPLSAFAEALRVAKVAADQALTDQSPKIIGLVSLLPKEGKSTVAKNFASLLAFHGAATLLIDADTRNPALTRAMGWEPRKSSRREASALPPLAELLRYEPESGLCILPCVYDRDDPRAAEGLTAATFSALLKSSDQSYEYIVIDLPPIGPVVAGRGIVSAIDAFVFVVEWGVTSRGAVRTALAKERSIREKLLGVILNKVDIEKLKEFEHFASDGYYRQQYHDYYNRGA